jgi:oligopeptide transport system permease protein
VSDETLLAEEKTLPEQSVPLKGSSLSADAWKRLKRNKMAMAGLYLCSAYILIAMIAPILPIAPYDQQIIEHQNLPPSFFTPAGQLWLAKDEAYMLKRNLVKDIVGLTDEQKQELATMREQVKTETIELHGKTELKHMRYYLLGTDDLGRDVLSRTIYGGQISMLVGVLGALFSVLIGIVIGAIAGYVGGRVDYFIMRFIEVLYGLPYMLLVIILMAIFGNNPINLFVALALVSWLTEAQVVRGQVISLKNSEFVEAAKSVGASTGRIIFRHLLPNTIGIIIVFATLRVPTFIMSESFLSYLGLGISAPAASWGSLIKDGVDSMQMYPWRLLVPATAMTLFLFFMNFLGDGLRDAFDPQSKQK